MFTFGHIWGSLPFVFRKHRCHGSLTSVAFPSPPRQAEQRILSRVHSLERRLEALAAEFSSNWQKEAMRLERLELRQGTAGEGGGGSLSQEDTLALLEGLVSRREAALKEDFRRDTAAHIQVRERSCGLQAAAECHVRVTPWACGVEGARPCTRQRERDGPAIWRLPSVSLSFSSFKTETLVCRPGPGPERARL